MAIFAFLCSLLFLPVTLAQLGEPKVEINIYEGPKECDDEDKITAERFAAIHYTAKIDEGTAAGEPGKEFDSSSDQGVPRWIHVGMGEIVQGWDEGLQGICKDAKVQFIIPPELGLGDNANGFRGVPAGATLNYDCHIIAVRDEMPEENNNVFADIDANSDGKLTHDEILAYFKARGQDEVPEGVMEEEDKDKDGVITWAEFGGPKGEYSPGEEPPEDDLPPPVPDDDAHIENIVEDLNSEREEL